MLRSISIKNYKSIYSDTIELGRINIFIGANGSGKSNILEAVGMLSGVKNSDLTPESLINKGIRVAMPSLTSSSFLGKKQKDEIEITYTVASTAYNGSRQVILIPNNNDILSNWSYRVRLLGTGVSAEKPTRTLPKIDQAIIDMFLKYREEEKDDEKNKSVNELLNLFEEVGLIGEDFIKDYLIYSLNTQSLRGLTNESNKRPFGLYGEGLDYVFSRLDGDEMEVLNNHTYLITWLDKILLYPNDEPKFEGYKIGRSTSKLYLSDKFMRKNNNIFSAENSNEGALHILFYLLLFISKNTPSFFAIDNIENGLNPGICRILMKELSKLAKTNDKQALITTHNPAVLDGININDEDIRLFEVFRNDSGHTKTRRIKTKEGLSEQSMKLSELWMRGYLGARDEDF